MKSRKQRKLEAKQNNEVFVPQYNGTGVLSFEDYYGVGNERFNNKFVQFNKYDETVGLTEEELDKLPWGNGSIEPVVEDETVIKVETNETDKIDIVEAEMVEDSPKSFKDKAKQKLKKLFNK